MAATRALIYRSKLSHRKPRRLGPRAVAAGFTTLAANYDFSQPFYATQSNYLTCITTSVPPYNTTWYQNSVYSAGVPCAINQVFDAVAGANVLDLHWDTSYPHNNNNQILSTLAPDNGFVTSYPLGAYYEAKFRVSRNEYAAFAAFWAVGGYYHGAPSGAEFDFIELYGDYYHSGGQPGWDNNTHNWPNGGACCGAFISGLAPGGFDITQYHIYGMRITTDGSSAIEMCGYIDNMFQGCNPMPGSIVPNLFVRSFVQLSMGASNNVQPAAPFDMDVEWVHVWSCASWQTTNCPGQVLTEAP